jgi:hypothetical protein
MTDRIYPRNRVAAVMVWLLDRLPKTTRDAVLSAYWSPEEIETLNSKANDLEEFFGKDGA